MKVGVRFGVGLQQGVGKEGLEKSREVRPLPYIGFRGFGFIP